MLLEKYLICEYVHIKGPVFKKFMCSFVQISKRFLIINSILLYSCLLAVVFITVCCEDIGCYLHIYHFTNYWYTFLLNFWDIFFKHPPLYPSIIEANEFLIKFYPILQRFFRLIKTLIRGRETEGVRESERERCRVRKN